MNKSYKTERRSRIMEVLRDHREGAMSAADIQARLAEMGSPVNKTTVYRYLDKLEEQGQVMRYAEENGRKATYQLVERTHKCDEHLHLKCVECGTLVHLDCGFMDTISEHVYSDHGFMIQCRNSVIYGLCKNCLSKEWE